MQASAQSAAVAQTVPQLDAPLPAPSQRLLSHGQVTRTGDSRKGRRPVAIVGSGVSLEKSASLLHGAAAGAENCTVVIDTHVPGCAAHRSLGLPVTGPFAGVSSDELRGVADEFILAFSPEDAHHAVAATWRLISEDVDFRVMPESMGCVYHLLTGLGWKEMPVVSPRRGLRSGLAQAWKRAQDVLVASATSPCCCV